MFAAHHKIDNLIVTIDSNGQQIDGPTSAIAGIDAKGIEAKVGAFGWDILHMNGHDIGNIIDTLEKAKSMTGKGKPIFIIMKTEMGHPIDFMVGSHKWHGISPSDAELEQALAQLPETLGDY